MSVDAAADAVVVVVTAGGAVGTAAGAVDVTANVGETGAAAG